MVFCPGILWAQDTEPGGMRELSLDSVVVRGYRNGASLTMENDGGIKMNMKMLNNLPKILGNADPIHYTSLLPGVQTNNEYDGGIHIQGCDNSHNFVSLGGVPIYNVSHLLGFFSVFNGSHFPSMSIHRNANSGVSENRLGGFVDMALPTTVDESINGDVSVGLISSQGTIRIPLDEKQQLTVSGRASYINMLYSGLLKNDDSDLKYSFYDLNASYLLQYDSKNKFIANMYMGNDDATINMMDYDSKLKAKWGNSAFSLHWLHDDNDLTYQHILYKTKYNNDFSLKLNSTAIALPSSINEWGYRGDMKYKSLKVGGKVSLYSIHPQEPYINGGYFSSNALVKIERLHTQEFSLYADKEFHISSRLLGNVGLRGTIYNVKGRQYYSLDPSVDLKQDIGRRWWLKLNYSVRHQYLLQTGVSSVGLPIEFWMSTGVDNVPPQYQHSLSLSVDGEILDGNYSINAEIYHKWLFHLQDYQGTLFDFINTKYDVSSMLYPGKGKNYGINVMINKRRGKLKGWVSYSLARAMRFVPGISSKGYYPAKHERLHELNCVATYSLGKHWTLGSTMVWATGTPYTPVNHYYLSAGQIIANYSEHNSKHLSQYFKLDMSVNYRFNSKHVKEHGLNFSVYNLTYSTNRLFYYMKFHNNQYYYSSVSFLTKILPSISYYCKF